MEKYKIETLEMASRTALLLLRHGSSSLCADTHWQGDFETCHCVTLTLVALKFLARLLSSHLATG